MLVELICSPFVHVAIFWSIHPSTVHPPFHAFFQATLKSGSGSSPGQSSLMGGTGTNLMWTLIPEQGVLLLYLCPDLGPSIPVIPNCSQFQCASSQKPFPEVIP